MSAFITLTPLRLPRPPLSLRPHPTPALATRRPRPAHAAPPPPSCALRHDLSVATFSALAIALSWIPLHSSPLAARAELRPAPPPAEFVLTDHATAARFSPSASASARPVSVIGVAKAPIHDYGYDTRQEDEEAAAALDTSIDDARREFVLAARLITSVLLGVMVGVERRATRLNLGVRSITLLALSSALVSVVITCKQVTGIALLPAAASVPAVFVSAMGLLAGTGLFVAARNRSQPTKELVPMCLVVGIVVAMGGACGAGLSLVSAGCYLAAIGIMRGTDKTRKPVYATGNAAALGEDRELRVESEDGWDVERRMVLRIENGDTQSTRVVEVGRQAISDGRYDFDD